MKIGFITCLLELTPSWRYRACEGATQKVVMLVTKYKEMKV